MALPTPYVPQTEFKADVSPDKHNGTALDEEFDALRKTTDGILAALDGLRRADGALKNAVVHADAFDVGSLRLMGGAWTPRGAWTAGTLYKVSDVAAVAGAPEVTYVCAVAHEAGADFTLDKGAGYWIPIAGSGDLLSSDNLSQLTDRQAALNNLTNDTSVKLGVRSGAETVVYPLDVFGAARLRDSLPALYIQDRDNTGDGQTGIVSFRDSAMAEAGFVGYGSTGNSDLQVYNSLNGDVVFGANAVERMRVASNGTVGINTTQPDAASALHVAGNVFFGDAAQGALRGVSLDAFVDARLSGGDIVFRTNDTTERVRISSSGNVGVGVADPTAGFEVAKGLNGSNSRLKILNSAGVGGAAYGARISAYGSNGQIVEVASIDMTVTNGGTGSEDADIVFRAAHAGELKDVLRVGTDDGTVSPYLEITNTDNGSDGSVNIQVRGGASGPQTALLKDKNGNARFRWSTDGIAFFDETNMQTRQTVTGSADGNAALESLLSALQDLGLITDSTT